MSERESRERARRDQTARRQKGGIAMDNNPREDAMRCSHVVRDRLVGSRERIVISMTLPARSREMMDKNRRLANSLIVQSQVTPELQARISSRRSNQASKPARASKESAQQA